MTMSTAGGVETKSPMTKQNEPEKNPAGVATPSRWHRHRFRRKVPSEVVVKGQLRMRSPSGAFVMVGVSVVLVGMTIAVIGYWPYRSRSGGGRTSNGTDEITKQVRVAAHPVLHSEKLKLIGPVIMGIGLFIFICANTMLYENRDMETRLLMQRELYSTGTVLPPDTRQASGYFQRRSTPPALQAKCVEGCYEVDLSSSGFQSFSSPMKTWSGSKKLLRHNSLSPSLSFLSIHSDSGKVVPENVASTSANTLSLPLIKLNRCLLDKQGVSHTMVQDVEGSAVELQEEEEILRLSWMSNRREELKDRHVVIDMDNEPPSGTSAEKRPPNTKREFGSTSQVSSSGHSKSLDLGQQKVLLMASVNNKKNRSWPRLDHIGLVNYAKLESKGESSDRLLETTREPTKDVSLEMDLGI